MRLKRKKARTNVIAFCPAKQTLIARRPLNPDRINEKNMRRGRKKKAV